MAGTTRLELATSAVTVSTFNDMESHWKYVVDNVIVHRDVYRGCSVSESLKSMNAINIVFQVQILPALQSDRHIPVLPQKIMKGLQIE
jgi:hypothetical protein